MPVSKNRRKNGKKAKQWSPPSSIVFSPIASQHRREVPNNIGLIVESGSNKTAGHFAISHDQLEEYLVSKGFRHTTPQQELNSLRLEFMALDERKQKYGFAEDSYDFARWLTYKECLACLESKNPAEYEYDEESIRKAGFILLNEKDAPNPDNMHDRLFWSFIPRSEQRVIDILWDGIGEWKA